MFSLRNFLKSGFLQAIGQMADYQIILNAAGWMDKGALTQEDLSEIQSALDTRNESAEPEPGSPPEETEAGESA